ncbi:hypothetical protein yc1106_02453 [Curvularia clavata]|uniref:Mtf2-like C-terminal domain-containing protein n=1 Tax=Curvularia clavata TaxID=95742 RepID=A0A9Q8Z393_CURCL|nr:hypothetical protein yc1106_02453 [Curvularia clavata]
MSACSGTVRAVSRSRVPPLKTLLPFLYQTTTIQQCRSATQPITRRSIASRSRLSNGDEIPFVDENLPPPVNQGPARKTTITGSERAAFEKLYKKFNTEGRQKKEKDHVVELDQIADEYYEDDEENSKPSLDEIFDEAMKGESRLRAMPTFAQRQKVSLEPAKETTTGAESGKARGSRRKGVGLDTIQLREMRRVERERVDKLIRNASTDRDLWQILDREVLTKVRELDLDNINTSGSRVPGTEPKDTVTTKNAIQPKSIAKPGPPSPEQRVLFQNYPHHLITAVATLRSEFPSSPLPLSILPMIKSLGRSSHVLGATTTLYKYLIRTAWVQKCSYATIDTLLTEMDNNAIEFDPDILELLNAIIREHNQARSGLLGRDAQLVYSMEMHADDIGKIHGWRKVLMERLGLRGDGNRPGSTIPRAVPQSRGVKRVPTVPRNSVDSQNREKQDALSANGHSSEVNDSSRDDSPFAEGTGLFKPETSEAIPFAEGHAVTEIEGQEKNNTAAEASNEQRQDDEHHHGSNAPAKVML